MAYLTLAQFCQRIVRPSEESPTFVRDQLEEGLSPSKFFFTARHVRFAAAAHS